LQNQLFRTFIKTIKKYFMNKIFSRIPYVNTFICIFISVMFIVSCTKKEHVTPTVKTVTPDSAAGNAVITLTGGDLSNIQSAVFDLGNVPIAFNPNFNTGNAVLFRVPAGANVGSQHIVFTNAGGYQFSVPFTVLAVPSLTAAFPTEWEAGNTITITGNYLQTANHVALSGSSDTATIVSATATSLVITMPASSVASAKLTVFNNAGSSTTSFSVINMDQQLKFFTEDYGSGMQDWSWDNSGKSNAFAVSGTESLKEVFTAGGGQGMSFHNDNEMALSDYQYLSLWIKGGTADNTIKVFPDAVASGSAGSANITIPSGVWTHITVPMSLTGFSGVTCQRFDFQITGPATDQTLYFDNVILVKQ
jgi:IPT/TIG domain